MPKIFISCEDDFFQDIIKEILSNLNSENIIVYTYYSKQGTIIQKYCSEKDIRVLKLSNNGIDGIVECINKSDSIILFYNHIRYCTGLDLIFKIGITYNIPTLVYSEHTDSPRLFYNGKCIESKSNLQKLQCFKSSKNKKIINHKLINYTINDNEKELDLVSCIEKLRIGYSSIAEKKKKREIVRIELVN